MIQVIRLVGKTKEIFPIIKRMSERQGNKTIGEIIRESK